jgi:hypothetical protein
MSGFETLTPQQQALALRNAAIAMQAGRLKTLDVTTGAPAAVRAAVGSAQKPEDRLATIRKAYPDAEPFEADNFVYTDPKTGRPTLYNPPGFDLVGDTASVFPEIAEVGGGGTAAGLAALPAIAGAGPTGGTSMLAIPLAYGLGAAAGREAQSVLASKYGNTVDTRNIGERLTDAAVTTGANVVGYRAGELVDQGIRNLTAPVARGARNLLAPTARQNAVDLANARVEPRAGAVSGSPAIQLLEQGLAATPGGSGPIREKAVRELAGITGEADDLARSYGPVKTPQEAGETIRSGARNAAERFRARQSELYEKAFDAVGAETPVDMKPLLDFARELEVELAKAPATRSGTIGRALEKVRAIIRDGSPAKQDPAAAGFFEQTGGPGGIGFETLRKIRTDLGRDLDDPVLAGATSAQKAAERRLYGVLTDTMKQTAAKAPNGQKLIETADRYTRFNMTRNMDILQKVEDLRFDEQILQLAMRGSDKGGSNLAALRRNLEPEEWDVVAGSVLGRLGRATPGRQGVTELGETAGDFSAATFLTNWSKMSPEARNALWGGTRYKSLIPRLNTLARVVDISKDADKLANTSGTARVLLSALGVIGGGAGLSSVIADAVSTDEGREGRSSALTNVLAGTAAVVGGAVVVPRVAAKLITSPAFVSWLETGVRLGSRGTGGLGSWVSRLGAISAANPEIREEIRAFRDALRPQ